jgi:hypothetical protein
MAQILLREKARALRQNGESIRTISQKLKASKSTVSYWCRNIALTPEQMRKLSLQKEKGAHLGRLRAAEKKRAIRIKAVKLATNKGSADVGKMNRRDLFMLGLALYWGEGYKSGNEECGLTNSDPAIIKTFIIWLRKIYTITSPDLILRISINEGHRRRLKEVQIHWVKVTGIPLNQFTKTSFIKANSRKIYSDPENHFGTLRIKVRRGTALRRRIMGSIAEIRKQFY